MSLTEEERAVLFGGAVVTVTALTAAAIVAALEGPEKVAAKHSLVIQATAGGTTSPAPDYYEFAEPSNVTVSPTAFEGYTFKGWYLNGNFAGTTIPFTFLVSDQNLLIASFEKSDGSVLIPAYVKPVQNCVAEDWWHTWKETVLGDLGFPVLDILHLEHDFFSRGFIKFKICDAAGNGVSGQQLAVYTEPMPDVTDFGVLLIGSPPLSHEKANPLILVTDGAGECAVLSYYKWTETGEFKETVGRAGRVHWGSWFDHGDITPIYNLLKSPMYTAFTSFTRLLNPIYRTVNSVHAYWRDNPNLAVWGDAYADCNVKIEPSKEY